MQSLFSSLEAIILHSPLFMLVVGLLVAVIVVTVCRSLKIPSLLGYLLVGFLVSPDMLNLIHDSKENTMLGEIGIVFLMFTIGLEFSLPRLKAMRKLVFGVGVAQVVLTLLAVMIPISLLTGSPMGGFAVGAVLTMSSTAIVSKLLTERMELAQPHGQIAIGVLLFQDIAVVPLLILLPALSSHSETLLLDLGIAAIKIVIVLVILLVIGQRVMRPWFHLVARQRSSELFMINVLLVTLGIACLTELSGLSMALGAFVAGMLISETEYRYQVEEDIRPFRDILLGFFFVTVGLKIEPTVLINFPGQVLMFLLLLIPGKLLIVYAIARFFGHKTRNALHGALVLAQGGEFGFVLLTLADQLHIVTLQMEQAIIAALLLSMLIAPFIIQHADKIISRFIRKDWVEEAAGLHQILVESMSKDEHVMICGYGQSGQALARILEKQEIPFFSLDLDPEKVQAASIAGDPIVYGDATRKEVLIAAGLPRAKAVVVTFSALHAVHSIMSIIRSERADLPIILRMEDETEVKHLKESGAYEVIVDVVEGSLMLATQALQAVGASHYQIMECVRDARIERYDLFRGFFRGLSDEADTFDEQLEPRLFSIPLPDGANGIDHTLDEMDLEKLGVKIKAIRRNNIRHTGFEGDWQLQAGDVLILLGLPDQLARAEDVLLQGHTGQVEVIIP